MTWTSDGATADRIVVAIDTEKAHLVASCIGRIDRIRARLHAGRLDAELARGEAPETERLRAVRATMLTSERSRAAVASAWLDVIRRASARPAPSALPLQRERVLSAADAVEALAAALRAPAPVPARGVAIAVVLLTDGLGPLYNRRASGRLRAELEHAAEHLHGITTWRSELSAA